jgi:hypothetical protein
VDVLADDAVASAVTGGHSREGMGLGWATAKFAPEPSAFLVATAVVESGAS